VQHTKTVRANYHGMLKNNILIVEDNQHLRKILAEIVRFYGYEVSEARTGTQAIKAAVCIKPNLILLDLGLPDMSGIEAGRAIRNNPQSAHIPIIACSASLQPEEREEALGGGMVDYLLKPISVSLLKAKIETFILGER
jgi:CheY-like chemotaxis protein